VPCALLSQNELPWSAGIYSVPVTVEHTPALSPVTACAWPISVPLIVRPLLVLVIATLAGLASGVVEQ